MQFESSEENILLEFPDVGFPVCFHRGDLHEDILAKGNEKVKSGEELNIYSYLTHPLKRREKKVEEKGRKLCIGWSSYHPPVEP